MLGEADRKSQISFAQNKELKLKRQQLFSKNAAGTGMQDNSMKPPIPRLTQEQVAASGSPDEPDLRLRAADTRLGNLSQQDSEEIPTLNIGPSRRKPQRPSTSIPSSERQKNFLAQNKQAYQTGFDGRSYQQSEEDVNDADSEFRRGNVLNIPLNEGDKLTSQNLLRRR